MIFHTSGISDWLAWNWQKHGVKCNWLVSVLQTQACVPVIKEIAHRIWPRNPPVEVFWQNPSYGNPNNARLQLTLQGALTSKELKQKDRQGFTILYQRIISVFAHRLWYLSVQAIGRCWRVSGSWHCASQHSWHWASRFLPADVLFLASEQELWSQASRQAPQKVIRARWDSQHY